MKGRLAAWSYVGFSLVAGTLLGCGLLTIEVSEDADTTVDGAGVLGGLLSTLDLGGLDDFDLSIEQELADQGVDEGDLRSVRITELSLTGEPDLGFVSGMAVYVSATGIEAFEVATLGDVPAGATSATFTLDDVDLADAIAAGGLHFRVDASGEPPEDDTAVNASLTAEVTATPKGACHQLKDGG